MNRIDTTGVDLKDLIRHVYDLSLPQGLGFLHYQSGSLTDDEIQQVLDRQEKEKLPGHVALYLDYIKGRSCKMLVFRDGDNLFIHDQWMDHYDTDLEKLLKRLGVR